MVSLRYRPDLDGLRAVAVLGVVIYHAFPWVIPGGFLGVDIFFVISGYLISGILYKGHKAGNFSFEEFYARRIRRLFPALITMLVITMAYGWLILLPDEFEQLGKHVAAGTLFIQNIVFWQESGYFDTAASLKPLLHLWSLAVEEQFYIFFPPILLLIWKRKWPLAAIMGVLLIATFILNVVMSVQNSVSDFFLTPYRAWEFLGGSLLAWWHYDKGHEEEVPSYREALSLCGIVLLGIGMAFIHTGDPYPGWRAIVPVAGTLLLMEGGRDAWVNSKILSNPALVWIGLISYPLYLFHWPALSFVHIVKGESPKPVYLADALIISLILSVITYYFIEKKVRHHKSKWTILLLTGAFIMTGITAYLFSARIIIPRNIPPEIKRVQKALKDWDMLGGLTLVADNKTSLVDKVGGDGPQTLFVGDSNMQQYAPRITKILKGNQGNSRGAILVTKGGILPIGIVYKNSETRCSDLMNKANEIALSDHRIDRVVIASRWTSYFNKNSEWKINGVSLGEQSARQQAMADLGRNIHELTARGKKVILVLNIPTGSQLDPRSIYPRTFKGTHSAQKKILTKEMFLDENENGTIIDEVARIASVNGAELIDPMDYLCTNGVCIAEDDNGVPIHFDDGHLCSGYVRENVKYLDRTVEP
jgi:peptidoglycan/LPS O-acetylase OafA/YrhL